MENEGIIMASESKQVTKFKEAHLKQDEKIIAWCDGFIDNKRAALILTGQRVVSFRKGLLGEHLEAIPIAGINSIDKKSGILKCLITLHGSGNKIEFDCLTKVEAPQFLAELEKLQNPATPKAKQLATELESQNKTSNPKEDVFEQLKKLGELKELGILSDEEFTQKKQILMERM
jgi:hypothetical protein|tara:strand:+ start:5638 stop:6162 length:525 start_codon:yes stop_codon:yes gene_type:complete